MPSPRRRSPSQALTPSGRGVFYALALELRQVAWLEKFKFWPINKYDGSNNPKEFIQVYDMVIETTGGDDQVKANYLSMILSGAARS
jgi:hypothetical protein